MIEPHLAFEGVTCEIDFEVVPKILVAVIAYDAVQRHVLAKFSE